MRLICGFVRLDRSEADPRQLDAMVAALKGSRQPAARAVFREGAAALALLDYSANAAPSLPVRGAQHFAADVRLDEPAELAARLGSEPTGQDLLLFRAATTPGMLSQVLGDFAFALWDAETETLTCARDNFGIRPLAYVYRPGEIFAFASLPAALHGSGIVPRTIDRDAAIRQTLLNLRFDDCLVAGIKRLPPSHRLTVSRAGIRIARYWQLDRGTVGTARVDPGQAAIELRRRIEHAVRSRTPAGAEIGSHLSGGLDSSAVAILAARNLREDGRRLHAYSLLERQRNDVQLVDETEYVSACLKQEPDIDWQAIRSPVGISRRHAAFDIDTMAPLSEEYPETQIACTAQGQGVDIVLTGWGGDEAATFNGRGLLGELLRRGKLRTLGRELTAAARKQGVATRAVALRELVEPLLPARIRSLARRLARKPPLADPLADAIKDKAAGGLGRANRRARAADGREIRWHLITGPHIAHRAEHMAQIGARHGYAYAFPLLDRRVVEYALSLPTEMFVRNGERRQVFRDAMQGVLPELVRQRPHKFPPFPGWLIEIADSQEDLDARLVRYAADPRLAEILDFETLRRLGAKCPSAAEARAYGNNLHPEAETTMAFVNALALAGYLRQFDEAQAQ